MKKKMKRMAALAMAAAMVVSTPVGAVGSNSTPNFSGTTSGSTGRVFFKQNVTTVVVPTSLTVAFNPDKLTVNLENGITDNSQVVSRAVAMVSEATKDHKVGVTFNIQASGNKIKFVDNEDAVNEGTDHNVLLQLMAATDDDIEVYSGVSSNTKAITVNGSGALSVDATELSRAAMSGATGSGTVVLSSGTKVNFKLGAAKYNYPEINLGSATTNLVSGTLAALGGAYSGTSGTVQIPTATGITGFKFTGMLNKNADWYDIDEQDIISIEPVYSFGVLENSDTVIDGTGAFLGVEKASTTPAVVAPSATTTTFTKTNNADGVSVVFNPGSYTSGITAVKWSAENSDSAEWKTYAAPDDWYSISNNTLTVESKIFTSAGDRYWRVYFADDVYVTLTFSMQ